MTTEKTSLVIIFSVWAFLSVLGGIGSVLTLISYWRYDSEPDQRKRKVLSALGLTSVMLLLYTIVGAVVIGTNDNVQANAIMDAWAYSMWFFLVVGAGATAFALAKFFRLFDNPTWVVTIGTALAYGLLGAATLYSITPAFQLVRWVFYAFAWLATLLALGVILLADRVGTAGVKNSGMAEDACEYEIGARTIVRLWLAFTWILPLIAWTIGDYGIKSLPTANPVFEQASYLVVTFLALVCPALVVLMFFNPDTRPVGRAASGAGNMINKAGGSMMSKAHDTVIHTHHASPAKIHVVHSH